MLSIFLRRGLLCCVYLQPTGKELSGENKYPPPEFRRAYYSNFSGVFTVIFQHFHLWYLTDIQDNLEMNPTTPLHEDTLYNLPPESPHQEVQRCTRNSPCKLLGRTICPTPTNHVHNLDEELGTDDTTPTPPTSSDLPPTTQSSHPAPFYCL